MIKDFSERLIELGLASKGQIIGYSESEIKKIEDSLNVVISSQLRDFLSVMGVKAGSFMQGTDIFNQNYLELYNEAKALLEENEEAPALIENMFVLAMHQGYEFVFVDLSEEKKGSVGQFVEGEGFFENVWVDIEAYLSEALNMH